MSEVRDKPWQFSLAGLFGLATASAIYMGIVVWLPSSLQPFWIAPAIVAVALAMMVFAQTLLLWLLFRAASLIAQAARLQRWHRAGGEATKERSSDLP